MGFQPLSNRLLVRRISEEETTASGLLVIPDSAKEKPQEGEVLAIGPGRVTENGTLVPVTGIQVGDRVLFGKYNGTEIKLKGESVLILEDNEVYGLILPEETARLVDGSTVAFTGAL